MSTEWSYKIVKKIGILSNNASGWTKELNLISWNGRPAKYDLRDWGPNHEKVGKGITLTNQEMKELKKLLRTE